MDFSPFYSTSSRKILSLTGLGLIAFASITHVTLPPINPMLARLMVAWRPSLVLKVPAKNWK